MKSYSKHILWFVLFMHTMFFSFCGKNTNNKTDNFVIRNIDTLVPDTQIVVRKKFQSQNIIPFCDNFKWGYADLKGDIVIDCKFEQTSFFSEGLAFVKKNGKFGFIDSTGKLMVNFIYDDASYFSFGIAPVKRNTFWGFIDKSGKEILPCKYEEFKLYDNESFHVKQNNQWGTVAQGGIQKILPLYDNDFIFSNNEAIVQRKRLYGIINKEGKTIVECNYTLLSKVTDSLYIYQIGDKYGLMTASEKQIIQPKYDILRYAGDSTLIAGYRKTKSYYSDYIYQLIDFNDSAITKMMFSDIQKGTTNLLLARGNALYGFISFKGDTVIPFTYHDARPFNSSITKVKQNSYGIINYKNETIISFEYDDIQNYNQKYIKVYKGKQFGIFTNEGEKITDCIYTDIDESYSEYINQSNFGTFSNGLSAVAKDCRVGFINEKGQEVIPFQFHWASNFDNNGLAIVKFNELYGLINKNGKIVADIKYEHIYKDEMTQYYYATIEEKSQEFNKKIKGFNREIKNAGYFGIDGKSFFNSEYNNRTPFSTDSMIQLIRQKFKDINSQLNDKPKETYKISDTLIGTLYNNKLVIIDKQANYSYEYYYDNDLNTHGPFFALITNNNEKTADRYYFSNGTMIKHIDKNNKNTPVCDAPYVYEDDIHFTARKHLADFYSAKKIAQIPDYRQQIDKIKLQVAQIDSGIAHGAYKKGDHNTTTMGFFNQNDEIYLDQNNNTIFERHTTSAEAGEQKSIIYYKEGVPIYSLSLQTTSIPEYYYHDKWYGVFNEATTYTFKNTSITFRKSDCAGCKGTIHQIE